MNFSVEEPSKHAPRLPRRSVWILVCPYMIVISSVAYSLLVIGESAEILRLGHPQVGSALKLSGYSIILALILVKGAKWFNRRKGSVRKIAEIRTIETDDADN